MTGGPNPDAAKGFKLALALAVATGCNSPKISPSRGSPPAGNNQGANPCTGPSISPKTAGQEAARERAYAMPLEDFDPGDPELFRTDTFWPYFDRLRQEEPVHYCKDSMFGPYWSMTKYNDIMDIETNHAVFSSAASLGGITIRDAPPDLRRESFIAMDQPRHGAQRKTVAPMFTPTHLDQLAINIRKRSAECLDNLPQQRGVRLGRPGLDRTDHADAGRAVRLPLGGPPQADALVRRRNHASRPRRPRRHRGGAAGRTAGMRDLFRKALEGADQSAAEERPAVDDGAQRRHPRHGPEEFPRQSDPADRRRQRHHPQHAVGQHLCAEPRIRTSTGSCATIRR